MKKIETHYKSKGLTFPKDIEAISVEFRKVKWQWFIPSSSHSTWGSVKELLITQLCHTGKHYFWFLLNVQFCLLVNKILPFVCVSYQSNCMTQLVLNYHFYAPFCESLLTRNIIFMALYYQILFSRSTFLSNYVIMTNFNNFCIFWIS